MRTSRWQRPARILCGLYVAAAFVAPNAAQADTSGIGVIAGSSAASGMHSLYTPAGLIPTAALVDLGVPDALTTISTGPATFARASVADPGEILANPDALFAQSGGGYEPGTVPRYPYRASASSSVGEPTAESSPAPGLSAKVEAQRSGSTAKATTPSFEGAAVATVGTMVASTDTFTDGRTVTVHARSEISDFVLLGGLLTIDSIVLELEATSDGTVTTTSGGTTITGATVAGTPVVIDQDGVRAANPAGPQSGDLDGPLDPLNDGLDEGLPSGVASLNELLAVAGVRVTVVEPEDLGAGTARERMASGLRIDLDLSSSTVPALEAVLEALPYVPPAAPGAPGLSDALAIARAHHLTGFEIGRARVSLDSRPRPDRPARPAPAGSTGDGGHTAPSAGSGTPPLSLTTPVVEPGSTGPGSVRVAQASSAPDLPVGASVAALALLGLILVPFAGDRLGSAAGWLLPVAGSDRCPLEGS